ncbi:hypothetical protein BDN70DRAFT_939604 [Pholiota conissans]|uniref:Uncharacterized protein n=1 Tax=Pholiota conissans TaxID=109636 RepID=A0A9P6CSG1_9AGAR|nr:hypothetical protein BDN70DRAFT_939604 [Pholiota conissans]
MHEIGRHRWVAKSLLKQFDVKPKKHVDGNDMGDSDDEHDLEALAAGLDDEERIIAQELNEDEDEDDEEDDVEGWVNEMEELMEDEQQELLKSICPLRKLAFKIIHSTTILLPAGKACLEAACLAIKLMPQDIAT